MRKVILLFLCTACAAVGHAQTAGAGSAGSAALQSTPNAERARIGRERAQLESVFAAEDTACYRKFLVNNCLDEVKLRRRDALADLRRQEISLNAQDRKAKAAEQVRKTEDRASPQKQQQEADRRASSLKDFDSRLQREKQKNADRAAAQSNEKAKSDAAANRIKGSQDKAAERAGGQASRAEEVRKFNERQAKAKERQARHDRDQLSQTKPPAQSLPQPD